MEEGSLRVDANVSVRPAGDRGPRDQGRAQEHEQLPLPRAGDRGRDRAPDRAGSRAAARSSRRPFTSTRERARSPRCARRSTRTTTATSPSRTWCRWRRPRRCSARRPSRCPSSPPPARALPRRARPARRHRRPARRRPGPGRVLRGGARPRRRGRAPKAVANWLTNELAAVSARTGRIRTRPLEADPRSSTTTAGVPRGGPPDPGDARGRRRRPGRARQGVRERRRPRGEIVDRAIEAEPEAAEKVREGKMKAIGPLVGAVMKETRGAADGGEATRPRSARKTLNNGTSA